MTATRTDEFTVTIAGNVYTLWTVDGKVTHCACKGRWAKAEIAYLGDEWLEAQFRAAVAERASGSL